MSIGRSRAWCRPARSSSPRDARRSGWLFQGGGSLYILDLDGNALVFSGTFREISETPRLIIVDPQERAVIARRIDTEEQHVLVQPIEPAHRFAIWFRPSRQQIGEQLEQPEN